ncbi:MAG: diaminopimelate epimerase, partial [Deferribacteres bacterium]|nr:diaminopimelate epimerase [Deferribacteres bacterium]
MKLQFTKMQALGNDFIILDDRSASLKRISSLSKKLCDRRFGIGADQLLILCCSTEEAGFRMRIFNADGSEVEMCGNGIRCLGKYIWDSVLTPAEKTDRLSIETLAGIIHIYKRGRLIRVDMGEPVLDGKIKGSVLNHPLKVRDRTFRMTCVSMGNPHAVIVDKNIESFPLQEYGPEIEHNSLFPNRTNVEFIEI